MKDQSAVIVLHGLLMKKNVMSPLCNRLKETGMDVHNYQYTSRNIDIKKVTLDISEISKKYKHVVFVGHSLGGIVSREAIRIGALDNVRAVITLGTPHKGSEVARLIKKMGTGKLLGNADKIGLIDNTNDNWDIDVDLHCIAGRTPIGVISFIPRIFRPFHFNLSDGTVMLDEAILPNAKTTKIFKHTHTSMIYSKQVSRYISEIIDSLDLNQ